MNREEYKNIKSLVASTDPKMVLLGIELMKSLKGPLLMPFMQKLAREEAYLMKCMDEGLHAGLRRLPKRMHFDLVTNKVLEREAAPLSAAIADFPDLLRLKLNHQQITALPETIGQLKKLTDLDLSHNLLQELPTAIGRLERLRHLNLTHNQLTELPNELTTLDCIGELQLSDNALTQLPEDIGKLHKLWYFVIDNNPIEAIPDSFAQLSKVERLSFRQCPHLASLPKGVGQMNRLRSLDLGGLPKLTKLPANIFSPLRVGNIRLDGAAIQALPDAFSIQPKEGKRKWQYFEISLKNTPIAHLPEGLLHLDTSILAGSLEIHTQGSNIPKKELRHLASLETDRWEFKFDVAL